MGWILALLVITVAIGGAWALFRADDTQDASGNLLGGRAGPKELPPPPPLPGYRPSAAPGEGQGPPPGAYGAPYGAPAPAQAEYVEVPAGLVDFVPASIVKRFIARLIDSIVAGVFTGFIGVVATIGAVRRGDPGRATAVLVIAVIIFTAFYEVGFIAGLGQTPGKMFMGIRVISSLDGGTPTVAQALVRWGFPSLIAFLPRMIQGSDVVRLQIGAASGLLSLLIYLWATWDPRRQGLHDKAAQTLVQQFR
jgi:uncharacterized RDD family membrane protein YckC